MIRIMRWGAVSPEEIFARQDQALDIAATVAGIIGSVRSDGDDALLAYTEKFDKVRLSGLEVTEAELQEAFAATDPALLKIMEEAAARLAAGEEF